MKGASACMLESNVEMSEARIGALSDRLFRAFAKDEGYGKAAVPPAMCPGLKKRAAQTHWAALLAVGFYSGYASDRTIIPLVPCL
jgi:hypothetical protein